MTLHTLAPVRQFTAIEDLRSALRFTGELRRNAIESADILGAARITTIEGFIELAIEKMEEDK